MNDFFGLMVILGAISMVLVALGLSVLDYVISSLALYRLAKKLCVKAPGLAWVPIANTWTIGAIVDQYDKRQGYKRQWRVTLLTLTILAVLVSIAMYAFIPSENLGEITAFYMSTEELIKILAIFYLVMIVLIIVSIVLMACQIVCLYKVFEAEKPQKAVKYLFLSLLVPLAQAICLLKCAGKPAEIQLAEEELAEMDLIENSDDE